MDDFIKKYNQSESELKSKLLLSTSSGGLNNMEDVKEDLLNV